MPKPLRLPVCDDRPESERHVWDVQFDDGDTCLCGRFYLSRGEVGEDVSFELERAPAAEEEK
jgi:hypothetical protein